MRFKIFIVFYFWCLLYSPAQELSISLPENTQTNYADRDQESKREVKSISITQNGQYQYSLYPDRVYQLNIAKEGYTTEYQTIDLTAYSHRYQVQETFSLYPFLGSLTSDSLTTLYGYIKDKPTGNKLNPHITLLYTHSKQVAIPNVQTFNGGYQMLLRPDSSYQLIVAIDGYFPRQYAQSFFFRTT